MSALSLCSPVYGKFTGNNSMNSKKVIIYSTPTCIYCKMTKEFFAKHNVQYEEFNVAIDQNALDEMVKKSHQMGVPVVDIGGEIFVGFDRRGIAKALGIEG